MTTFRVYVSDELATKLLEKARDELGMPSASLSDTQVILKAETMLEGVCEDAILRADL